MLSSYSSLKGRWPRGAEEPEGEQIFCLPCCRTLHRQCKSSSQSCCVWEKEEEVKQNEGQDPGVRGAADSLATPCLEDHRIMKVGRDLQDQLNSL